MYSWSTGRSRAREHLVAQRPLHGQHGVLTVLVGDLDALRCGRPQPLDDGRRVRRVRHEEDLELAAQVDDDVVDRAAVLVAAQGVLRLARLDAAEVVGEAGVDERRRPRTAHEGLAQMADVEQPDRVPDRRVLGQNTPAGVLQRHAPTAELGELRTEGDVSVVQGRVEQIHGRKPIAGPSRRLTYSGAMVSVSLSTSKPTTARADALILGIRNDDDRDVFAPSLEAVGFTGEKGQVVTFPGGDLTRTRVVVAVALPAEPTAEQLRRAAGEGVRRGHEGVRDVRGRRPAPGRRRRGGRDRRGRRARRLHVRRLQVAEARQGQGQDEGQEGRQAHVRRGAQPVRPPDHRDPRGRARRHRRQGRQRRPRLGQHPARRPPPAGVRRRDRGACRRHREGLDLGREATGQGTVRRHPRRRRSAPTPRRAW